mgnify:FL=1
MKVKAKIEAIFQGIRRKQGEVFEFITDGTSPTCLASDAIQLMEPIPEGTEVSSEVAEKAAKDLAETKSEKPGKRVAAPVN